ncbi:MAG: dicarboxylate/amino acid:cation symporter [Clostridia bacterium]|nr:dicarboxylate/amino acid:cation symporter [Clostridia bacterium]
MKRIGLLPRLIIGIVLGIVIGTVVPLPVLRVFATFQALFAQFLSYVVPFIIIAFIAPGIAELGKDAGRLLGITTGIAYLSTVIAGIGAYFVGSYLIPNLVNRGLSIGEEGASIPLIVEIAIPPLMDVMTALITAFLLGLGMAAIENKYLYNIISDFKEIIEKVIRNVIIPILPFYIASVFASITYAGNIAQTLLSFIKVFAVVVILHWVYLVLAYLFAGSVTGFSPFKALKNMMPAYFTAIGTQSSAATIPITVRQAKLNNISEEVAEFVIPLCATIHLAGSTITLTICSIAVLIISGMPIEFGAFLTFIFVLGVTMIAAPGVPGGAVMAAIGLLEVYLGFGENAVALMIALYLAQDSFGTACNVTGDGAIAMLVNKFK